MDDKNRSKDAARRTRWVLRAVSLLFALSLWFFVSWDDLSDSRVISRTVPIRYLDVPEGCTLAENVKEVEVRMEGSLELLAMLDRNAVTATISLQDLRAGKYRLPITVNVPDSVRLIRVTPSSAEFELYRMIERTMTLLLDTPDEEDDRFNISEVTFDPSEVVIKGPETLVMSVRYAEVSCSAADLASGEAIELPVHLLAADDSEIEGITPEPETVSVRANVTEALEEADVRVNVPIRGTPAAGHEIASVKIEPETVTLRGTRASLANIRELTLAPIDVTGNKGDVVLDIPIDAPNAGISLVGQGTVRVSIEIHSPFDSTTYASVPISIVGEGSEGWIASPASANLVVERDVATTQAFDEAHPPVELYVDVTNIVADRMVLPVLTKVLVDGTRIVRIDPQQVTVTKR